MPGAEERKVVLDRYGRKELIRTFIRILLGLAVLLLSAGSIGWVNAWIYALVNALIMLVYGRVLGRLNPQMLNARGRRQKGTKRFDKVILGLWMPTAFIGLIVAGLDAVRYGWSTMPFWLNALGLLFYLGGVLLSVRAFMFEHMGWGEAADSIRNAVERTIRNKTVTYDLARQLEGATRIKCSEFGQAIVENM